MNSHNRIDLDDAAQVVLWADNLSISVARLHEIVARVGPMTAAVLFYAKKCAAESNRVTAAARTGRADRGAAPPPLQNATAGPVTPPTELPSMTT